ncbi:MAG: hypothetical protein WAN43_15865 [Rhodomicrobium sp.]
MPDSQAKQQTLDAAAGFDQIALLADKLGSTEKRSLMRLLKRAA